ncbi:MAG: excinuclease ABC subunit UvrA, partial [Clostridia bacterium]|nr:excinuclease ABC subunit UvrA [Clostridia bacterium]
LYSTTHFCDECGYSIVDLSPTMFSFNNPYGACPTCEGLGFNQIIDVKKFNIDKTQSVQKSGLNSVGLFAYDPSLLNMYYRSVAYYYGVAEDTPICDMPKGMFDTILYGTKGEKISVVHKFGVVSDRKMAFEGIVPIAERRYRETTGEFTRNELGKYITEEECPHCLGRRLREDVLSVYINKQNISTLCDKSVEDLIDFFSKLKLNETEKIIAEPILKEINARLGFLNDVGLDYLTLSRRAGSLSGGEAQRIRLATQIGSGLTGVIYILDEPSIGLHQRDNDKLIGTLKHLRDLGNTVIVVEHDEDTMREADYIIDIGRLAGVHGGKIVAEGTVEDIMANEKSLTGQYLSGKLSIPVPKTRRPQTKDVIKITGCRQNNLKKVDLEIPIGLITLVTGVSGSGKSSLINETLYPIVYNHINKSNLMEGKHSKVTGLEYIDKVINIDQSPIGKTPRSNPATYTNVFTDIRQLFASTIDAKERGYTSGRFSFNIAGGRCENCGGAGIKQIEMFFLPDVYVPCEICDGKRYNRETLEVKYKGKSIYDVLEMTISEANEYFANIPKIKNKLQTLVDVGLGYVKLGQPATELSGGEAQRVKLATELSKRATGKSLYILDEPTTGLHLYDIDKLVKILYRLVESGNTIVVIEHNLDVIKCADHIIDMGMEGGSKGGEIIATGTPEEIVKNNVGYTAKYLKKYLKK